MPVLERHCADARFVKNLALEQANYFRAGRGPSPSPAERQRQLAEARQANPWLAEGSSSVQQQALRDFDRAMAGFFAGTHRRPTWWKKGRDEGFCIRDVKVRVLNRKWASVVVPKCGEVRFRLSRPLPKSYGMGRVTLDAAGRWHVSFAAPQPSIDRERTGREIGIDRGVATTIATSEKAMYRIPSPAKSTARIGRLQRRLARQQKGSKRIRRTKAEISRTWARITDRRTVWIEKLTTRLVCDYDVIFLERLEVSNMVRRPEPKPDPGRPGEFLPNGTSAKAGLNRVILGSAWGLFLRRLQEKAAASSVTVVLVDARYTSQTCKGCGHVSAENRKSQAVFSCVACGHRNHADFNAAQNILARGLEVLAPAPGHGASARVSPVLPAARTSEEVAA